jgi:hypothetical protein
MIKYPSTAIYKDIMGRVPVPPAISILLPLHPLLSSRTELQHRVKVALENIRHRLLEIYPVDATAAVMARLQRLQAQVDYSHRHKSIGLFASPQIAKLWYFDTAVDERIVIGDSFAVRELVADSKQLRQYLLVVLSEKECRFYHADENRLDLLRTHAPTEVFAYANEKPERVANFSDPRERKEIVIDKFIHHMDDQLSQILALHPLPVFVLGPERVVGHFKAHSRHLPQVAAWAHGNYVDGQESQLLAVIQPSLDAWRLQHRQRLLALVAKAADEQRLSTGIDAAWTDASRKRGRLLLVEKGFRIPASHGETPDRIIPEKAPEISPSDIPDTVDALIGQVIANGGDVEFVEDGDLSDHHHIALIRYY